MHNRTCNRCNLPLSSGQAKFCSHACANRTSAAAKQARIQQLPTKLCDVAGCRKVARSRTAELCPMHYHRLYRYGSLERVYPEGHGGDTINLRKMDNITGQRFGTLTVAARAGGRWVCDCDCGQTRLARTSELRLYGDSNTCGNRANHLAATVGYSGAHSRVRRALGSVETRPCIDCGSAAQHWSYDHGDAEEMLAYGISANPVPYSANPDHYVARCVSCHKRHDLSVLGIGKG